MDIDKYCRLELLAVDGLYRFPSTIQYERDKEAMAQEIEGRKSQAVAAEQAREGERTRER